MWRPQALAALALAVVQLSSVASIAFDPCQPLDPIRKGGPGFVVGIAFWPGGTEADWGDPINGLNPCNETHRANLTAAGAHFATYSTRVDKLSVLKATFPEQLALVAAAPPGTPLVVSAVAFRGGVRSEARYVVSGAPPVTGGTGFVATLSLMSKFELGVLKYLQFYNLTCNDCGGWRSNRCLNGTSCTLPVTNCTCPDSAPSSAPSSSPAPAADANAGAAADEAAAADAGVAAEEGTASVASDTSDGSGLGDGSGDAAASGDAGDGSGDAAGGDDGAPARRRRVLQDSTAGACNYTQFTHCAATVNLAFEGLDVGAAAFSTASQVRKLNSYSLVALFAKGKALFFDFTDKYDGTMQQYWGKFGQLQQDVADAYSGNAEAGRVTGDGSSV